MKFTALKEYRDKRAALISERQELVNEGTALAAKTPTEEIEAELQVMSQKRDAFDSQILIADGQIAVLEDVADIMRNIPMGEGASLSDQDPKFGFESAGEYFAAVYQAGTPGGTVDPRLGVISAAITTSNNESSGPDGGYAIPPEFSANIRALDLEDVNFLAMTDNTPVSGNSMAFPATEVTPWGTTGSQAFWRAELATMEQSKLVLDLNEFRLNELTVIIPMSGELLDDQSALTARISREASAAINYKSNDAIVNGSGAGQPEGYMNSGALVTVAKEGSQVADTIVAENVANMWSRQLNPVSSTWFINPDAWPQFLTMVLGNQPIWTPPVSGFANAPGGFLFGRPIVSTDTHQTLGDAQDISFVNLRAYATITKRSGIQADRSMHLWFDQNAEAFRFIFRLDGHAWMKAPVLPPNSTATRSPFVTLAERA